MIKVFNVTKDGSHPPAHVGGFPAIGLKMEVKLTELKNEAIDFNGKVVRVFSDGTDKWYTLLDILNAVPGSKHKVTHASRNLTDRKASVVTASKNDINESDHRGSPRRVILNQKALKQIVDMMGASQFGNAFSDLYNKTTREESLPLISVVEKELPSVEAAEKVVFPIEVMEKVLPELKMSEQDKGRQIIMDLFGENTPPVYEFDGKQYNKVIDVAKCFGVKHDSLKQIINRNSDDFKSTMRKEYLAPSDKLSLGQSKVFHYNLLDMEGISLLIQKIQTEQTNLSDEVKKNIVKYQQYMGGVASGLIRGDKEFMNNLTSDTPTIPQQLPERLSEQIAEQLSKHLSNHIKMVGTFSLMMSISEILVKKGIMTNAQGAVVALRETAYFNEMNRVDLTHYISLIENGTKLIGSVGGSEIEKLTSMLDARLEEVQSTVTATISSEISALKENPPMYPDIRSIVLDDDNKIKELIAEIERKDAQIAESKIQGKYYSRAIAQEGGNLDKIKKISEDLRVNDIKKATVDNIGR